MKPVSILKLPVHSIIIKMSHQYKSSFRFTTFTPFQHDDYRKAKHIINHIIDNPQSLEFREPVKWQELNLMDYPQLIKNPMDLGTILEKLNSESYENIQQFLDDFELIWDNCKTYNSKGTWIYGIADKLEKNGKKMLKSYFPSISIQSIKTLLAQQNQNSNKPGGQELKTLSKSKKSSKTQKKNQLYYEDEEEITEDEKMRLADKFKSFSPEQNKQLVQYIQQVCPNAFREHSEGVQIVVDNMDIITFKQIMQKSEEIEQNDEKGVPEKRIKFE